jgi:hypothetical protein
MQRVQPNPFYALLLAVSTLFVVTALGYTVSPYAMDHAGSSPSVPDAGGESPLARWLDRHGPAALGIEFVVMLLSGVLAMATDRWFTARTDSRRGRSAGGPR